MLAHSEGMHKITQLKHQDNGNSKRVTFHLDDIDCEMVRYKWDGPVHCFADRDHDGIREPMTIETTPIHMAFQLAWTYSSDAKLKAATDAANKLLRG